MAQQRKDNLLEEKKQTEYLAQIERLVINMLKLSNEGINKFNNKELLTLCGLIRDCAFKIKKNLKK